METNQKTNISLRSKLLLIVSRFFLPDVSKVSLQNKGYISNEEMYVHQNDRVDTNPAAFDNFAFDEQKNVIRNITVSLLRRRIWKKANYIGMAIFIASTVLWSSIDFIVIKTQNGIRSYRESVARDEDIQRQKASIEKQAKALQEKCAAGQLDQASCKVQLESLRIRYESIK